MHVDVGNQSVMATPAQARSAIAVEPTTRPAMCEVLVDAVRGAGGIVVPIEEARALIFADPDEADQFPSLIGRGTQVEWVQLPYAGVETFVTHLDHQRVWTCGKGIYAPPVAEWIMTALLSAFRDIPRYARASSWSRQDGRNLLGSRLTILGGGGITNAFLKLIAPWGCEVTVVRRSPTVPAGAHRVVALDQLKDAVAAADAVIVALALTNETRRVINIEVLSSMRANAWLINVGRGGHVVTDDLAAALTNNTIAGAVLDVTDPEPLPDGHILWTLDNCLITPHVGNTPEMGLPLIADRVGDNVTRWIAGDPLVGVIDVAAGY